MAKMSKKERESSIRFSRIKGWFKKKGFDVSNVEKSQKTYSSNERIRKDILKQLGIDAKISKIGKLFYNKLQFSEKLKEDIGLKKAKDLSNQLQSVLERNFTTNADAASQNDNNSQDTSSQKDDEKYYNDFKNLDGYDKEDREGYPRIYEFYEALDNALGSEYEDGIHIQDGDYIKVTKEMVEKIQNATIRNWALQAFEKK